LRVGYGTFVKDIYYNCHNVLKRIERSVSSEVVAPCYFLRCHHSLAYEVLQSRERAFRISVRYNGSAKDISVVYEDLGFR